MVLQHVDDALGVVLRDVAHVENLASALLFQEAAVGEGCLQRAELIVEDFGGVRVAVLAFLA